MDKWFEFLTFDLTPEQRNVVVRFCWRLIICVHIAVACGWLSWLGISGFALASDVERKINEKQTLIFAKLDVAETSLKQTTKLLNKQISAAIASQIRLQAIKSCKATSGHRDEFITEIERLQDDYREYNNNEKYDIPACDQL